MRKLWISALLAICGFTGARMAVAENFAPVVPAAHHRASVSAPACGCDAQPACAAPATCIPGNACGCTTCNSGCNGGCDQCAKGHGGLLGHLCGNGGHGGHGHHHRRDAYDRSSSFHCGCNGSYKFPVPPLSTFHWPGMYSHQLITDYHSPWRFPPIKPYVDEVPLVEMGIDDSGIRDYQPTSGNFPVSAALRSEGESMSAKVSRLTD